MSDILYKRFIVDEILKYLDSKQAVIIHGARQVGKTSLMKYLLGNHLTSNSFYLDLELPGLLDLCNKGPEEVYNYLIQKGADKRGVFLLLDEIQYLEDPTKFIKILHDHYPNIKLIASGSSSFDIKRKFKDSLVGRAVDFELYPLSFEEFLHFRGKEYELMPENSDAINEELIPLVKEFIRFGGYPGIVLEKSEEKKLTLLSQIINTYIHKDIRDIGNIRNISGFNKLVEILASQSGQLLNVSELSNTLDLDRETVLNYLNLLESTFIIRRIRPFQKNLRSELTKNPKVFMLDTGLMHLLWLKEFPGIILGNSFETLVFSELLKSGKRINFWRTSDKREVDFILPKSKTAIEVKINFQKANMKNLNFLEQEYGMKTFITALEGRKTGKYVWELVKSI